MSQALTLARPYARAAFAIARESSDGGGYTRWSDALGFASQLAAEPRIADLLGNPGLSLAEAVALLSPDDADSAFSGFLSLLGENRRLVLLPEIATLYATLRAEAEHVVKARITSATALHGGELDTIATALRRRFGRDVEIETAVDERLIGGAIIDAGDVVIDGSLKGKLERLQAALAN